MTPFQALYGFPPPWMSYMLGTTQVDEVEQQLLARDQILWLAYTRDYTIVQGTLREKYNNSLILSLLFSTYVLSS